MNMLKAVTKAIGHVETEPEDVAAIQLAKTLASEIDTSDAVDERVAGQLLKVLESLYLTPAARNKIVKKTQDATTIVNPLDELRAKRAERVGNA